MCNDYENSFKVTGPHMKTQFWLMTPPLRPSFSFSCQFVALFLHSRKTCKSPTGLIFRNWKMRGFVWFPSHFRCYSSLTILIDREGVPINMGFKWKLLYRLRSINTIIAIFQFKNLKSKCGLLSLYLQN